MSVMRWDCNSEILGRKQKSPPFQEGIGFP
nr:MAG TPA: hypothetical protein [Caudoviricetes sp.]